MKQRNNRQLSIYIFSFLFTLLVVIIGSIAGRFAPFGEKSVLVASHNSDYLTHYYELYDFFKSESKSLFSNASNVGYDITTLFTYKVSDPTNYLILLFERNSIPAVLNILYFIKIAFSSLTMSILLCYKNCLKNDNNIFSSNHDKVNKKNNFVLGYKNEPKSKIGRYLYSTNWTIIAISIAYALSVPMLTTGMNTAFTSAIAIFPLIILGIEKLINGEPPYSFIVFFTLSIYCNLHISMITGFFMILFFVTRDFDGIKDFLIKLRTFIIGILLSFTASAIIIVNSFGCELFNKEVSLNFPMLAFTNPFNLIKQFMTRNTLSMYSLYTNFFDIAFGSGFIFLTILYIFTKSNKKSTKLKNLLLLTFILFGTALSTFHYLFNGFTYTPNRTIHYGYIIVFLMLYISYETLADLDTIRIKNVIFSGVFSFAIIIATILFATDYDNINSFILSLEYLLVTIIITILYSGQNITKSLYKLAIMVIILIEIIPNNITNTRILGTYYISKKITRVKELQEYEVTKQIHTKDPDARILFLNVFNSNETPFTICFGGYDYVVSTVELSDEYLEPIGKYTTDDDKNGVNIYNNKYSMPYNIFNKKISNYNYDYIRPFSSANIFTNNYLNIGPIFTEGELQASATTSYDGSTVSFSIYPKIQGDLYVKANYVSHIGHTNNYDEIILNQNSIRTTFPTDINIYQLCSFNNDTLSKIFESSERILLDNIYNSKINVNSSINGYFSTGLPYIRSMDYIVNGKKVSPISFLENNCLIPVSSGSNIIEIRYNPLFLTLGAILSFIGILIIILLISKKKIFTVDKSTRIIARHLANNYVYYTTILVIVILSIISLMLVSGYPFGERPSITGDGLTQQYAIWAGHNKNIRAGNFCSIITFDIAGFCDMYRTVANDFIAPWNLLKYSVLPDSLYLLDYTVKYFSVLFFSAITFIFYLTHREANRFNKKDWRLIPLGLMYSLCSYSALFFSYEGFKYTCYLPLIILGIEKLVYHNKKALYICSLILVMLFDPYHAFLLCEFIALYFFTMNYKGIVDFIKKGVRFAICSISAAGLTAFTLLPFYLFTTSSPYQHTDKASASLLKTYINPFIQLSEYRTSNIISTVSQNNAQAAIYAGMILIFVIPLYIICNRVSIGRRISLTLLAALLYISFNNELLNYIFHGFHFQTFVPNRHAIFFVFIMISMLATVIKNFKYYNTSSIRRSVIISSTIFILLYALKTEMTKFSSILSTTILSAFIALVIYSAIKHINNKSILKCMLYITIIDIIINFLTIFPNLIHSESDLLIESNAINKLADSCPSTKNFNNLTEYIGNHPTCRNIGETTDINTLSYFSSGYTSDMMERLNYYNLVSGNFLNYNGGNPLADIMLNIRYHIENVYDDSSYSIYKLIETSNNYYLYENTNYVSMGMVIANSEEIKKISYGDYLNKDDRNVLDYQNDFVKKLNGSILYEKINCIKYNESDEYDSNQNYFMFDQTYTYTESNSEEKEYLPINIKIGDNVRGKIYIAIDYNIYCIGEVNEDNHEVYVDYPLEAIKDIDSFKPSLAILNEKNLQSLSEYLSKNKLTNLKEDGKRIYADLDSSIDGELYISLPYYDSWKIYIDDIPVDKERFIGGIGVNVSKGKHSLRMEYHPAGALTGAIISVTTLLIIMAYSFITYRLRQKKHTSSQK